MPEVSTIHLPKKMIEQLKRAKEYPRQSYNELLLRMSDVFLAAKQRNQYDEFMHKIQQQKMKELWHNKDDEAWEDA